jgi:hypothetical protein
VTGTGTAAPERAANRALTARMLVGLATVAAVLTPLWLTLSVLTTRLDMSSWPTWASLVVGLTAFATVLAAPAVAWGVIVADLSGTSRAAMARTSVRAGLLTALPVGIGVDLSQVFIDSVSPWHRLAVHALFTAAFAGGLALFIGVVAARVGALVERSRTGQPARTSGGGPVRAAATTALGVVLASLLAVAVGWDVQPGMGRRMLQPLYLVVAGGALAGGWAMGRTLVPAGRTLEGAAGGPASGRGGV